MIEKSISPDNKESISSDKKNKKDLDKKPKFKRFVLNSQKEIFAGKDSEQNDLIVSLAKKNDILLHTKNPGSPFVNLGENPTKDEIRQGAIFCALKSQDFRDNNRDVIVNSFLKIDCYKNKLMKSGTWGVKRNIDTIKIKKAEILKLKKEIESSTTNPIPPKNH